MAVPASIGQAGVPRIDGAHPARGVPVSYPPPAPPTEPRPGPDPGPGGLDGETRGWAVAAHLSAFVGAWVLVGFLGPLVVYLLGRDRHAFVAHHAREALNFNLTFLLAGVVGGLLAFVLAIVTFGFGLLVIVPVVLVAAVAWIIVTIVAAVRAWDGEGFRYPLTIHFVR